MPRRIKDCCFFLCFYFLGTLLSVSHWPQRPTAAEMLLVILIFVLFHDPAQPGSDVFSFCAWMLHFCVFYFFGVGIFILYYSFIYHLFTSCPLPYTCQDSGLLLFSRSPLLASTLGGEGFCKGAYRATYPLPEAPVSMWFLAQAVRPS